MLKKLQPLSLSVLLGTCGVFAVATASANAGTGIYVGAQLGHQVSNSKATATDAAGTYSLDSFGGDGLDGGVMLGYGRRMDNIRLAVELEGSLSNTDFNYSDTVGPDSLQVELDNTFGASLIGGIYLTNRSMLYGCAGWVRSKFQWNGNDSGTTGSGSVNKNAFRGGVGFQVDLASNALRSEYVYTDYSDYNTSSGAFSMKVSPNTSMFRLGFVHNF